MRLALAFLIVGTLLNGCDYVDDPTPPRQDGGNGPGTTVKRRALLEEFTGHRCNTCPAAHAVAASLESAFGDELVVVGIHATDFFAAPLNPPPSNGAYSTDFRTPAGNAYATAFSISFLPTGLVNRAPFNSSTTISSGNWSSAVAAIVAQDAQCDIWVSQFSHNAAANTISAEVKVAVLSALTGSHNLTAYLTEDHVIDWQLNSLATPPDVEDYDHRHVLRANLNGTWGETLVASSAEPGDTLTLSWNNIPVAASWNAQNFALVAYAYSTATNEVLQVAERKLQP
jgi:hypothetical protein